MSRLSNNKELLEKLKIVYKEQGQNIFEGLLELEKKYTLVSTPTAPTTTTSYFIMTFSHHNP